MPGFSEIDHELHVDGLSLRAIAAQFGTPLYVYSGAAIQTQLQQLQQALDGLSALICFAVKANSNIAVLQMLAQMGAGADIVSEGELRRALIAGVKPERIVFSGVGKTADEIELALKTGIRQFNIESRNELALISTVATRLQMTARATIRVNPDVDALTHKKISTGKSENKFGIPFRQALDVFKQASTLPNLLLTGLHMHIGSQIVQSVPYEQAIRRIADLANELRQHGYTIDTIDLGGGFGIAYQHDHATSFPLNEYAALIKKYIAPLNAQIVIEPGRYLVGNAGVLLTRALFIKQGEDREFVILDAAMNDLIRPSMYDAWHDIHPLIQKDRAQKIYDVVGPVCETGDTFATQRRMAEIHEHDLVVIRSAGAYGATMSSTYNSRPLVAEVLVKDGRAHEIRRRQRYDEMFALEQLL